MRGFPLVDVAKIKSECFGRSTHNAAQNRKKIVAKKIKKEKEM